MSGAPPRLHASDSELCLLARPDNWKAALRWRARLFGDLLEGCCPESCLVLLAAGPCSGHGWPATDLLSGTAMIVLRVFD